MSSILDFLNDHWLLPCPLSLSHTLFVPPHPQLDPCCSPSWLVKTQELEKQSGAADGLNPTLWLTPAHSNPLPKPLVAQMSGLAGRVGATMGMWGLGCFWSLEGLCDICTHLHNRAVDS